jgi:putative pyruvate formate lyase activating enzyme
MLYNQYVICNVCPRQCGVDRIARLGICQAPDKPKVALASLHHHEEPAISGARGSGTIFFSHCNLACAFCQNWNISQEHEGRVITIERLREIAFELRDQGAHNINLVSPTPYTEMILEALLPVKQELGIPIVWNSNAYELESVIRRLEPLVDVYLPDLKFCASTASKKYCGAGDYFEYASKAVAEMWRQKRQVKSQNAEPERNFTTKTPRHQETICVHRCPSVASEVEIMTQGVIVRHLVIPGQAEDSERVLGWIADQLGTDIYVSLMAQYTPVHKAHNYPEINRRLKRSEYDAVRDYFYSLGFENGWVQDLASASSEFTPDFDLRGV